MQPARRVLSSAGQVRPGHCVAKIYRHCRDPPCTRNLCTEASAFYSLYPARNQCVRGGRGLVGHVQTADVEHYFNQQDSMKRFPSECARPIESCRRSIAAAGWYDVPVKALSGVQLSQADHNVYTNLRVSSCSVVPHQKWPEASEMLPRMAVCQETRVQSCKVGCSRACTAQQLTGTCLSYAWQVHGLLTFSASSACHPASCSQEAGMTKYAKRENTHTVQDRSRCLQTSNQEPLHILAGQNKHADRGAQTCLVWEPGQQGRDSLGRGGNLALWDIIGSAVKCHKDLRGRAQEQRGPVHRGSRKNNECTISYGLAVKYA